MIYESQGIPSFFWTMNTSLYILVSIFPSLEVMDIVTQI